MKFNLDCTRDTLFLLEEKLTISPDLEISSLNLEEIASGLSNYGIGEVANTLIALTEAGFLAADVIYSEDSIEDILVSRITYNGYQFIECIRPESVWKKLKSTGGKVGALTVNVATQIASSLLISLFSAQLGL